MKKKKPCGLITKYFKPRKLNMKHKSHIFKYATLKRKIILSIPSIIYVTVKDAYCIFLSTKSTETLISLNKNRRRA